MEHIILHIDVNNAFLSWSALDLLKKGFKHDIRLHYAVIGGDEAKRHGIVLAKSMLAKKVGIVTGESLYNARKKYPKLEVYQPQYDLYEEMSHKLFKLISKYSPDIEMFSIDECFVDYGKVKNLYGDEKIFAHTLKDEIRQILGFTVNIGIGNNKLCAKMASDFTKPDMVHTLYMNEVATKMWPLPIGDLFGIGRKTASKLMELGIKTIGDLAGADCKMLYKYFKNQTQSMIDNANGIDYSSLITENYEQKGLSNSTTLNHDATDKEEIYNVLERLADNLGIAIRKQQKYAYVVAVIIKDCYFKSYSHQMRLKNPTHLTNEIFDAAQKLFDQMWTLEPVRLIGIRLDNLVKEQTFQLSLFDNIDARNKNTNLEKAVDELKAKYGTEVINKASLIVKK